jgi:beta-hydroxylase
MANIGLYSILAYVLASLTYAYKFRGKTRYDSLIEYIRKGWPLTTPLNVLLYIFTKERARKPIQSIVDFPELKVIADNWEIIRDEALNLYHQKYLEKTNDPNSHAYYDLGFRTFYKYGWSKFYLNWYGSTHNSAKRLCPKTVEILAKVSTVNGAMFSILPPGGKLTRHLDPVACSLRFHLGLSTPNHDSAYINVDGENISWRDGQGFLFDETFLHFAENNSNQPRLILMCDVERPLSFFGKIFNSIYKIVLKASVVPNLPEDERGLINTIFHGVAPVLARAKELKQTNKALYLLIKYSVNAGILLVLFLFVKAVLDFIF